MALSFLVRRVLDGRNCDLLSEWRIVVPTGLRRPMALRSAATASEVVMRLWIE